MQIMNRMGGGGPMAPGPISAALSDPSKRRAGAQIIGQAYVVAHNLATTNREALDKIAGVLMEKKEIFGDELHGPPRLGRDPDPELDYSDEAIWPPPFFAISSSQRPRPVRGCPAAVAASTKASDRRARREADRRVGRR